MTIARIAPPSHTRRPTKLLLLACIALSSLASCGADAAELSSWTARRICSITASASRADASAEGCRELSALAERAREAVVGASTPTETLDRLNRFFFEAEKFTVTLDLSTADHLLPELVVAGRKGYCVGLAAVYLILAEELHLPIRAVATPKHLFLRWDDTKVRRNIELFQTGLDVPDAEYIQEQKIPEESIRRGVFLASLTRKEFLGFIHQNLGVLASQRGDFVESGRYYAKALRLNFKLAAAYYNRGNDELKLKQFEVSIADFTKALRLYPTDTWALHNRGLAWKGLGDKDRARSDFEAVLALDPGFSSAIESLRALDGVK